MSLPKSCPFSHLIGNGGAKAILDSLTEQKKLPPVLLFHGPLGVGKKLFAKALAEKLVEKVKKDHPDVHILSPEGKNPQHPIQAIRKLIEEAAMPPFEAPCKVFIIDDAEKMLATSSNALLKTLEEPPLDTYIFLICSDPDALLSTVVSRCRKIPFFPIPEDQIIPLLKHTDAKRIAYLSQGSIAKALRLQTHLFNPEPLFQAQIYRELLCELSSLKEIEEDEELLMHADQIFEEILYWIREHKPLGLEKALCLISECRTAISHHVKLKSVLEYFFLKFSYSALLTGH